MATFSSLKSPDLSIEAIQRTNVRSNFRLKSHPSGVGFNVARALTVLGNRVRFVSMVGSDFLGTSLRRAMPGFGMSDEFIVPMLDETPQSIVLFDKDGKRMVTTDLKEIGKIVYPLDVSERAVRGCRFAIMTNVNFSRALLPVARAASATIATDLQTASESSREYDADFLEAADVIFASHQKLSLAPEDFLSSVWDRSPARVAVIGMGQAGALLGVRGEKAKRVPAMQIRSVVNTTGAGDALFSCFVHFYFDGEEPILALRKAACSRPTKSARAARRGVSSSPTTLVTITMPACDDGSNKFSPSYGHLSGEAAIQESLARSLAKP
jgi:acarbose 7IV-phosphotransferase